MVKKTKQAISKYVIRTMDKKNAYKRADMVAKENESTVKTAETHCAFIEQSTTVVKPEPALVGVVHKIMVVGKNSKLITELIAKAFDYMRYRTTSYNNWERSKHVLMQIDDEVITSESEMNYHFNPYSYSDTKYIRFSNALDDTDESFVVLFPNLMYHSDMRDMVHRALYDTELDLPHRPVGAGFYNGRYYGMSESLAVDCNVRDNEYLPEKEVMEIKIDSSIFKKKENI